MDYSAFFKRLRVYLVGFFFGSLIVYFSFLRDDDRNLGWWLPKNRIVFAVNKYPIVIHSKDTCYLNCQQIDTAVIRSILKADNLNFDQSEPRKKPFPNYFFEGKIKGEKRLSVTIELQDTIPHLVKAALNTENNCGC